MTATPEPATPAADAELAAGVDAVDSADAEPATPAAPTTPVEVTLRRAPKVGRFMALGLLLGGIASFVLAIVSAGWSALSTTNTFWLTLLWTGPLGLGLGALAAFLLDRRSVREADRRRVPHEA